MAQPSRGSDDPVEQALDGCFDAVFAPDQWRTAMDRLGTSLGALGCCLNPNSRTIVDRSRLPASGRYRDMLAEFMRGDWKQHDLRHTRGWRLATDGKPMVFESDCSTEKERRALPIYQDLFARHDLEIFVGVSLTCQGETWSFNLVRSERTGGFEHEDPATILRVVPSLNRILKIVSQMSAVTGEGAVAAFERAALGAILLDENERVVTVNQTARASMGQGLDVRDQRLSAKSASENNALQALIRKTIRRSGIGDDHPVYVRREGKAPLLVEAVEIQNLRAEMFGFKGALLLITDPQVRSKPRLKILQQAFSLTPQEARVGRLLSAGLDAAEIGEMLSLRRSSVQQLVKSVLVKTNTRRQSALVALFAHMPQDRGET